MKQNRITKSEVQAFRKRWKIVNTFEKEELRATSMDEKLEQLMILMTLAKELGWTMAREAEAIAVRNRWNEIRKVYHA